MNQKLPQLDKEKIEEVNKLVIQMAPQMNQLISLLKGCGLNEFEIMVGNGNDKISWSDGKPLVKSPTQDQLTIELVHLLDIHYPPHNGFTFMNMIWNPNMAVAEKMAKIVAEYRKRDRKQVESQIVALLAAFKMGA